jgi:outer membrane assembly lipoprotein YfiO
VAQRFCRSIREQGRALRLLSRRLCYYERISDVTRDQKDTQQALQALNEVIRRYPATTYATDAKVKLDLVNDHLAGKEMEVGRFYERSGKWLAGTMRFRAVVDKYQQTSHTPEALYRLVECCSRSVSPRKRRRQLLFSATTIPATSGTSARSS